MGHDPKLDEAFGLICYQTDHYVIRAKPVGEEVKLYVHLKACGREILASSYVLGYNYLFTEAD